MTRETAIKIDQVIHSRRRTIAIQITRDGRVVVRAPLAMRQVDIERFVAEKASWIERKLAEIARQGQGCGAAAGQKHFAAGEQFLYLGQSYPLEIVPLQARPLVLEKGVFRLRRADQPRAAAVFEAWYKAQARRVFAERVAHLSSAHKLVVRRLRISSARTRWGSCSTSGTISLTWRLVMAPLPAVDYVAAHELAHLTEKNHAPRFWARVEVLMPGYQEWKDWLKENAACLDWG